MRCPAFIRDNLFVVACVAASALLHVAALVVGERVVGGPALVLSPAPTPVGPAAVSAQKPAPEPPKPAPAEKPAPGPKAVSEPVGKKTVAPKPPPKRVEKQAPPQAARPPAKANPGEADLVPLQLGVPEPMGVDMGQVIRIQIENRGRAASGTHHDALFYSASGKLDEKSARLGMVTVPGTLAPGAKKWARAQVLLPEKTPSGRAYLIVVLNADGFMPETNHANNQITVPIMVDAASVPLGDPDARPRTTVAWISSRDFRQLKAAQSRTLQPAVQNDATTTPDARPDVLAGSPKAAPVDKGVTAAKGQPPRPAQPQVVAVRPSKPVPPVRPEAQPKPATEAVAVKSAPPAGQPVPKSPSEATPPQVSVAPPPPTIRPRAGQAVDPRAAALAVAAPEKKSPPPVAPPIHASHPAPAAQEAPPVAAVTGPVEKTPSEKTPSEKTPLAAKPAVPAEAKPEVGAPQQGEGATSAVADRSSAIPTQLDESSLERQAGQVLVGKGVRITTARIRQPGAAALIAGASANPRMAVTFNRAGEAIKVEMLRSSGNADWDAVVIASMYHWTAEGPEVKQGGLVVRWTVLLGADN